VHGEAGEPEHAVAGGPPPTAVAQIGHGCVGWPVRIVAEFSWKFQVAAPLDRSSVPLGCAVRRMPPLGPDRVGRGVGIATECSAVGRGVGSLD
jgi:hypothetical protein